MPIHYFGKILTSTSLHEHNIFHTSSHYKSIEPGGCEAFLVPQRTIDFNYFLLLIVKDHFVKQKRF